MGSTTVAVIDSQSVRTGLDQSVKGIDGGKKINGIKRHLAVDLNGFPLTIF
ncbi:transposase, partial [Muribaculum intestinale]